MKLPRTEPCPFCGHKPKRWYNQDRPDSNIVRCEYHYCPCPRIPGSTGKTMAEAIYNWNEWSIRYRANFGAEIKYFRKRFKERTIEEPALWRIELSKELEKENSRGKDN